MQSGQRHTTNHGDIVILAYNSRHDITIRFVKTKTVLTGINSGNIRKGLVRDPYFPICAGVGYVGIGEYAPTNNKCYNAWSNMLRRCYAPSNNYMARTYSGCTVRKVWHCYQRFAAWYVRQPYAWLDGYELDKDLRVPGNKVYGPDTCTLIPKSINAALVGFGRGGKYGAGVMRQPCGSYWAQSGSSRAKKYVGPFSTVEKAKLEYKRLYLRGMRKLATKELAAGRISCAQHRDVLYYSRRMLKHENQKS